MAIDLGSAVCPGAPVGLGAAQALEFQSRWPLAENKGHHATHQDHQNMSNYQILPVTSSNYFIDCMCFYLSFKYT